METLTPVTPWIGILSVITWPKCTWATAQDFLRPSRMRDRSAILAWLYAMSNNTPMPNRKCSKKSTSTWIPRQSTTSTITKPYCTSIRLTTSAQDAIPTKVLAPRPTRKSRPLPPLKTRKMARLNTNQRPRPSAAGADRLKETASLPRRQPRNAHRPAPPMLLTKSPREPDPSPPQQTHRQLAPPTPPKPSSPPPNTANTSKPPTRAPSSAPSPSTTAPAHSAPRTNGSVTSPHNTYVLAFGAVTSARARMIRSAPMISTARIYSRST